MFQSFAKIIPPRLALRVSVGVAGCVLVLDQLSKELLAQQALNSGLALGLFSANRHLVFATWIAAAVLGAHLWHRSWRQRPPVIIEAVSFGCVAGGALSNLFDRLMFEGVRDVFSLLSISVFNIADASICLGAVGIAASFALRR